MPAAAALKALPWARMLAIARIVLDRFGEDIPKRDRQRLTRIVKKSKGDPRKLTAHERQDLIAILRQVDLSKLSRDVAGVAALTRMPKLLKPGR